jgi:hypothetical protein
MQSTTKERYIFSAKIVLYHNNRMNARAALAGYVFPRISPSSRLYGAPFKFFAANFSPLCRNAE